MTTLTAEQHTALLDALDALRDKHLVAAARGDLQSADHLFTQYSVVRDLVGNATIEASDTTPLWRDRPHEDWMRDDTVLLELVDASYISVAAAARGWFVLVDDDDDETVAIPPEHLPALIAMLQEAQRRIEAGEAK